MGWFSRTARQDEDAAPPRARVAPAFESVTSTRAFPQFLTALARRDAPVIVDCGPVIGSNVAFFGERLGCKIHIEDLFSDIETHARAGRQDVLPEFLSSRLDQADGSVDGVLLWDLFDYLDRPSAVILGARLARMVRKGGAVFGYFGAAPADLTHYAKFIVESETELRLRHFPATPVRRQVLQNRDIIKMFEPLTVAESFLLKSHTRETLFRRL